MLDVIGYGPGDFTIAEYHRKWYIGQVLEADDDEVYATFMKRRGSVSANNLSFIWPEHEDDVCVSIEKVFSKISEPVQGKRDYKLNITDRAEVNRVDALLT